MKKLNWVYLVTLFVLLAGWLYTWVVASKEVSSDEVGGQLDYAGTPIQSAGIQELKPLELTDHDEIDYGLGENSFSTNGISESAYEGTEVIASEAQPGASYLSNRIVAYAKDGVTRDDVLVAVQDVGGTIVGELAVIDMFYISVVATSETELLGIIERLQTTELFDSVSLDYVTDGIE